MDHQLPALLRRDVLVGGAALIAASALPGSATAVDAPIPVIDTHIHLFDPNRPQGAPYRGPKTERFYTEGALPETYRRLAARHHVVGAIAVEASSWIEDNLWLLEAAGRSDIMVGVIGNLQPDAEGFGPILERHAKNPLFRGIRYGNLWQYDLVARGGTPAFVAGTRLLAQAGLVLESANPRLDLLQALVRLHDAVPDLRIVIDHLPRFEPSPGDEAAYHAVLRELAGRPGMFAKLSEVVHPVNGVVSTDLSAYRARLDLLCASFGEDRIVFGSDWPNILYDAPLAPVFAVMRAYFADKPRLEQEKYFWRNALQAYQWKPRSPAQRALVVTTRATNN